MQLYYGPGQGDDVDLRRELDVLCNKLDANRLFIVAIADKVEEAEALVEKIN